MVSPYLHEKKDGQLVHYMSAADETGTLYMLELPKHLREPTEYMVTNDDSPYMIYLTRIKPICSHTRNNKAHFYVL